MPDDTAVPDLYRLAFMPGCFRCPKCGFQLSKVCINPNLDLIGTREEDRQSEPCPNDGTMLVHVTYKEQLEVYADRLKEEFERFDTYQTAVKEFLGEVLAVARNSSLSNEARIEKICEALRVEILPRDSIKQIIDREQQEAGK